MSAGREPRLSAFKKDLDRLAREVDELSGSMQAETRLAGEEAMGAELLASRELVAQLGILWDTAERFGDLYARQLRYCVADHASTWSALLGGAARGDAPAIIGEHVERRVIHLAEGVQQSAQLLSGQSAKASQTLYNLWKPFLAVLRQDWAGRRPRSTT
ncbi:MAG: hypothetical protein ACNA7W_14980 [Pseudomonadales bacterium]